MLFELLDESKRNAPVPQVSRVHRNLIDYPLLLLVNHSCLFFHSLTAFEVNLLLPHSLRSIESLAAQGDVELELLATVLFASNEELPHPIVLLQTPTLIVSEFDP